MSSSSPLAPRCLRALAFLAIAAGAFHAPAAHAQWSTSNAPYRPACFMVDIGASERWNVDASWSTMHSINVKAGLPAEPPPVEYSKHLIDLGCRFYRWAGSTWTTPGPEHRWGAADPYWTSARNWIQRANARAAATGKPVPVFSFGLSEMASEYRIPYWEVFGGYRENMISYLSRDVSAMPGSDQPFRWFGPFFHQKSYDFNTRATPHIDLYWTRVWFANLAGKAEDAGFHHFDFSVAHRTAQYDYPDFRQVKNLMSTIRSQRCCGEDPAFGFEYYDPSGVDHYVGEKTQKELTWIAESDGKRNRYLLPDGRLNPGCYSPAELGLSRAANPLFHTGSDFHCILKEKFQHTGSVVRIVELDNGARQEAHYFLTLSRAQRRAWVEYGMKAAAYARSRGYNVAFAAPAMGELINGHLEVGYVQGGANVRGGYTYLANSFDRKPLCEGKTFPVAFDDVHSDYTHGTGIYDAWTCGYADVIQGVNNGTL